MKKIALTFLFSVGLLLGFSGLATEASAATNYVLKTDESSVQAATASYLTPSNLSGRSHTTYTLTVSTNVGGTSSFTFDPGIPGQPSRTENASGSRKFTQEWTTNGLTTFTTGAKVVSRDYGPGPWFYGKAVIRH